MEVYLYVLLVLLVRTHIDVAREGKGEDEEKEIGSQLLSNMLKNGGFFPLELLLV